LHPPLFPRPGVLARSFLSLPRLFLAPLEVEPHHFGVLGENGANCVVHENLDRLHVTGQPDHASCRLSSVNTMPCNAMEVAGAAGPARSRD